MKVLGVEYSLTFLSNEQTSSEPQTTGRRHAQWEDFVPRLNSEEQHKRSKVVKVLSTRQSVFEDNEPQTGAQCVCMLLKKM